MPAGLKACDLPRTSLLSTESFSDPTISTLMSAAWPNEAESARNRTTAKFLVILMAAIRSRFLN